MGVCILIFAVLFEFFVVLSAVSFFGCSSWSHWWVKAGFQQKSLNPLYVPARTLFSPIPLFRFQAPKAQQSSGSTNHVLIHTTLRIHTHRTSKNAATTEINWVRLQIQRPKPSHRQRKILYSISANSQNHLKSTQSKDEGAAKQRKFLLWWSHGKEGRAHDQGCEEYKGILKLQAVALSTEAILSLDVTETSLSPRYLGLTTYRYWSALHITLPLARVNPGVLRLDTPEVGSDRFGVPVGFESLDRNRAMQFSLVMGQS